MTKSAEEKMIFEVVVPLEMSDSFKALYPGKVEVLVSPYQETKTLFKVSREVLLSKPEWAKMDTSQDYLDRARASRSALENRELQERINYEFLRR